MYFFIIAEYENEDIPKIHLTAEEPPQNSARNEYSERENQMLDYWSRISIPATVARGQVYVSAVIYPNHNGEMDKKYAAPFNVKMI